MIFQFTDSHASHKLPIKACMDIITLHLLPSFLWKNNASSVNVWHKFGKTYRVHVAKNQQGTCVDIIECKKQTQFHNS